MSLYPNKFSTVLFGILYLAATSCFGQDALINDSASTNKSFLTGQDVFNRLNRQFGELHCNEHSANYWLKTYSKNSNGFYKHLQITLPLLDYVSREVEQLNLPGEYALVPFIESHYNPAAKSKLGPAGLWQMIATTAKHNGVIISSHYDGRYSPIDSTQGATSYLTKLTHNFSDWQTALMAYNAGGTRMRNSLSAQGLKKADAQKKLPKGLALHTYTYVLKVKAIACLIAEPVRYGINLPNNFEFTPLQVLEKGKGFDSLDEIMKAYDVTLQDLIALNPSYKKRVPNNLTPGNILVPNIPIKEDISLYDQGN
jgi:membrane-bound lytic murein transglycosylase D